MAGRFAPSPTGPLHRGSLATALASWLEAKARGVAWNLRIEDLDPPRESPEAAQTIQRQLASHGLQWDAISFQSEHHARYQEALCQLAGTGLAYACHCSRKRLADDLALGRTTLLAGGEIRYPGHCRPPASGTQGKSGQGPGTSMRFASSQGVDDFVLRRADGFWAYHLAVVVDDAAEGISHIVRGDDLADSLGRHRSLQAALNLPQPEVLHVPVVRNPDGEKLSKQTRAPAIEAHSQKQARENLEACWVHLQQCMPRPALERWAPHLQALVAGLV